MAINYVLRITNLTAKGGAYPRISYLPIDTVNHCATDEKNNFAVTIQKANQILISSLDVVEVMVFALKKRTATQSTFFATCRWMRSSFCDSDSVFFSSDTDNTVDLRLSQTDLERLTAECEDGTKLLCIYNSYTEIKD